MKFKLWTSSNKKYSHEKWVHYSHIKKFFEKAAQKVVTFVNGKLQNVMSTPIWFSKKWICKDICSKIHDCQSLYFLMKKMFRKAQRTHDACENYCKLENLKDILICETRCKWYYHFYRYAMINSCHDFQTTSKYSNILVHWPIKSFIQNTQIDEKDKKKLPWIYEKEIRHEMLFNHVKNIGRFI